MSAGLAASTTTPGMARPPVSRTTPAMPPFCCAQAAGAHRTPAAPPRRRPRHQRSPRFECVSQASPKLEVTAHWRGRSQARRTAQPCGADTTPHSPQRCKETFRPQLRRLIAECRGIAISTDKIVGRSPTPFRYPIRAHTTIRGVCPKERKDDWSTSPFVVFRTRRRRVLAASWRLWAPALAGAEQPPRRPPR